MTSPYGPRPKGAASTKRPKSAPQQRDAMPGKKEASQRFRHLVAGPLRGVEAHHALPKSWIRDAAWREGLRGAAFWAEVYEPRIGIPLSIVDHARHTNRVRVIWHDELPLELRQYVHERWGVEGDLALLREHPARPGQRKRTVTSER